MSHDPLDRLYGRLLEAVRRSAAEMPGRALTIADVYQHLVPYRTVRSELGFAELQEYEHTLLRLFGGERGYLRVDMPQVAEEFKRELRSPNPILGIYRDYAAVGVTVNTDTPSERDPAHPRASGDSVAGAPAASVPPAPPPPAAAPAPPRPPRSAPDREHVRPLWSVAELEEASPKEADEAAPAPAPTQEPEAGDPREALAANESRPTTCWHCRERLPQGREVRFCPHCGIVQVATPCDDCGAPVEPSWKFCVLCGSARTPQPAGVET